MLPTRADAGIRVSAEFDRYAIAAGEPLDLVVVIDADDTQPGLQPLPGGLFSAGVRARIPASAGALAPAEVTPTLDFAGFAPGAKLLTTPTSSSFKGNIDLRPFPSTFHTGPTLATFRFDPPPLTTGAFTVFFEFPRDSANETVFVDSQGNDLDPAITFAPATVTVIAPLQIEHSPATPASAVTLTFGTAPAFDHHIEFRDALAPGSPWRPLPGTPHNSGMVNDSITSRLRFYRLVLTRRN